MTQTVTIQEGTDKYSFKFWLMMGIFYSMFIVRNLIGISFPVILYLAWVGLMTLLFEEHEIKALLVSFIPLYPAFQYKYAIIVCIAIYLIKYCRRLHITVLVIPAVFMFIWELLHHNIGNFSFWNYIRDFVEIICMLIIMCVSPKKKTDICQLSRVFGLSSVVAFVILLITTLMARQINLFELLESGFRLGSLNDDVTEFKFFYNANGLGFLCNMIIGALLINFDHKRGNVFDAAMIAFNIFIGLLTTSRTFIVILAFTILIYVLLQDASIWRKMRTLFVLACICFVALLLVYLIFPDIIMNYIARFTEDDVTNGRSFLFGFYNDFVFSSPQNMFFGIGMQEIAEKIHLFTNQIVEVPHNGYQEIVVAWGVIGFAIAAVFFTGMFVHATKRGGTTRVKLIHYLPLFLLLVNILAGQFITSFKLLSLVYIYEVIAS